MEFNDAFIQYEGFKGINLDKTDFSKFKNILEVGKIVNNDPSYKSLNKSILELDYLSLEDSKNIAKKFYNDYFNIHNIYYAEEDILDKAIKDMDDNTSPYDFYENINGLLSSIDPFDLPLKENQDYNLASSVRKPIYVYPGHPTEENRKIYFSRINTGNLNNKLTPISIAHEVTHLETESVIGYTDDYLNREILSIFVEKIAALKIDETGELLKLTEKLRIRNLVEQYNKYLMYKQLSDENMIASSMKIASLIYIKSALVAQKLFDMYLQERKEKTRDKYIDDVQNIMDGKIKLEEMLIKRGITSGKCQDFAYLKRHI